MTRTPHYKENRGEITHREEFTYTEVMEIDIAEKLRHIYSHWKVVALITFLFFCLGLFHYVFAPEEYQSSAILIQEVESAGPGLDGGSANILRTLTGMNLQGGQGNLSAAARGRAPLPVSLFPLIVNSTDFQNSLIHTEIEFSSLDTSLTIFDYFSNYYETPFRDRVYGKLRDYTIYLPRTLFRTVTRTGRTVAGWFRSKPEGSDQSAVNATDNAERVEDPRLQFMSSRELSIIENMRNRIVITLSGAVIEVSTEFPDSRAAAIINAILVERIQEFMTEYRIEKARQNLVDISVQYEDARERYEAAQMELAEFLDANVNISTNVMRTYIDYLTDQRNLRFNVYNSLAQEVEQSRISLQQQIPVFNVLEKPNIPISSTSEASDLILVFSVIIGLFAGSLYVITFR